MIWPFPGNTRITHKWNEPRPVSNPGKHNHGAVDIGLKIGSRIIAPERGEMYKYCATRFKDGQYWPSDNGPVFPFKNYFYDMYGGIIVLKGESGITHVFCHIYQNQLFNKEDHEWVYVEQKKDDRFPLNCYISGPFEVFPGSELGETGNSGFSTAPHCHYEQHEGWGWQDHNDRPDPEEVEWEDFR